MNNLSFIPDLSTYTIIKQITEGASGTDKYLLEKDGAQFLLRVGDKSKAEKCRQEFERLKLYADKEINTHRPVAFATSGDKFYSIVSWVAGIPVMDIIKRDTSKNHYLFGKAVGEELKKLHAASVCGKQGAWQAELRKKARAILENCNRLNIRFPGYETAEAFIANHLELLSDREAVILHGDFHWNNVVVEKDKVGIIDFSGADIGDPWYDFGGIVWALEYSESFVNGQLDGYFKDQPPMEFWKVLKLYIALYALEHFMFSDGTEPDKRWRIENAKRMLGIFGDRFDLEVPIFRN